MILRRAQLEFSAVVRVLCWTAAVTVVAFFLAVFDVVGALLVGTASELAGERRIWWGLFASHAVTASAGAMVTGAVALAGRPFSGWSRRLARSVVALGLSAYPAVLLGRALASGEWVKAQTFASSLQAGITAAVLLAAGVAPWIVARFWQKPLAWGAYWLGAAALALVNVSVLRGLYLEAHLFLFVVSVLLTTWAVFPALERASQAETFRRSLVPLSVLGLLALSALSYLPWMGMRTRTVVISQSTGIASGLSIVVPPIGSDHLARELAHLDELTDEREQKSPYSAQPPGTPPRSVLLVVVDTLRGDALPPVRKEAQPFAAPGDTPRLDAWLEKSYRFANAYAQSSQTKASMPSMFRSLEPFENPLSVGVNLSDFARDLGLRPIALVPQYFLMPAQATSQALLEGFDDVEFYTKDDQETMPDQWEQLLNQVGNQPFFAWVHFYNMHDPYYAGPQPFERGTSATEKYRLALRWLDEQFGRLTTALAKRGLDESTLVVLAADHGEHLGEGGRRGHGDGVHDEEVHVPLAFRVPGTDGGEIATLAGNLDVVPTIANLFRRPVDSAHRGRSLVPAMQGARAHAERALYMISGNERVHGLVTQDYKLVYTPAASTFNLYRRLEDPRDTKDLFGLDPLRDRRLVSQFVRYNPALFAAELEQPEVVASLAHRLQSIDPDSAGATLEFLLKAARETKDPAVRQQAERLYDRARSIDAQLTISQYLGKRDQTWAGRWDALLASASGGPDEGRVVRELASMGSVSVKSAVAPQRLERLAESKDPLLGDWLRLVLPWPKPARDYGKAWLTLLDESEQLDPALLWLVLENIASFRKLNGSLKKQLEARVLPWTESSDVLLAVAATKALRTTGREASAERMANILDSDADPRLKQSALHTLRRLRGSKAMAHVLEASKDPLLLIDAIKLSAELRAPSARPFLSDVAKNHYNAWTRAQAKRALKRLKEE